MKKLVYCSTCGKENNFGYIDGSNRYHCKSGDSIHYQNPKPTATLILPKDDTILFVRRAYEPEKGSWSLPGGFLELGETLEQGAKRELKEETGLTPIRMFIADHVSTFYEENGDLINLVPVFGIETETKRITLSSEHSEYKWMDFEDAERTLAWNGQKKGIRTVYEMLISNDDRMKWSEIKLK